MAADHRRSCAQHLLLAAIVGGSMAASQAISPASAVEAMSLEDIVKAVQPSIARVTVRITTAGGEMTGTGTAFIVDGKGDLVTNCHVVSNADAIGPLKIDIEFPGDERQTPVTILGCDSTADLAVIRAFDIDPHRKPLSFAAAADVATGEDVATVGYAIGILGDPTWSRGIVSAQHRSFDRLGDLIQTDANINHGNSGGPLLDMRGRVVGINTFTAKSTVNVQDLVNASDDAAATGGDAPVSTDYGIFYSRSSSTIVPIVNALIAEGKVTRMDFGLTAIRFDPDHIRLPREGVLVHVEPLSEASHKGVPTGSVVYSVQWPNGFSWPTPDAGAFEDAMAMVAPKASVKLNYYTLTDAGADDVLSGDDVPASEIAWHQVQLDDQPWMEGGVGGLLMLSPSQATGIRDAFAPATDGAAPQPGLERIPLAQRPCGGLDAVPGKCR